MKKIILAILIFSLFSTVTLNVNAQMPALSGVEGMQGTSGNNNHTAREEAEGKAVWEKLQTKELTCTDLSNDDFEVLGEYFMGQMAGDSHAAMNAMMIQMMGEESEEQMHIAMGKRMTICEPEAPFPQNMTNSGMMQMMMGGWSSPFTQTNNPMMNFGQNPMWWGGAGWLFILTWVIWLVVGILAAIWLWKQIKK